MSTEIKILIITIPEKGHINPMIGIAKELSAAGFLLGFYAESDLSAQLVRAGISAPAFFNEQGINISPEFLTQGKAFVEKLKDKQWLHRWIKTLLIDSVKPQIERLRNVVEHFRPDLIVADPMIYAAAIVAAEREIPWAGVSSSLNPVTPDEWICALTETLDALNSDRLSLFREHGIEPVFKVSDVSSPWLNIVHTTELYAPRELSGNDACFYTGSASPQGIRGDETDFPFRLLKKDTKKVYMSLGSQIYYHPELFLKISKALAGESIQLIFSVNELLDHPVMNAFGSNVISVFYAPQLEILKHVDLVISHGGANSVMETLSKGIPMALLPICNDQFLQAEFMRCSGAGIVLDPSEDSSSVYRSALLPLLQEDSACRLKAKAIGNSFDKKGGSTEAAKLIIRLIHERKPLMPAL